MRKPSRTSVRRAWAHVVGVAVLGLAVIGACGTSNGSPSPTGSSEASADPAASGSPRPKPTAWPTGTVEATIALGAADGQFTAMADDAVAAVSAEDPARMLIAMNDALVFLEGNRKNVPKLQSYAATKDVGDRLAAAYDQMIAGAHQVVDGLNAGNADAVQAGYLEFFSGNQAYVLISRDLGDLAEQAIFMKRVLLR